YLWAIGELGMAEQWTAKVAPLELIYKPTGQKIMFRGADDPMKIKSIKAPFGYIAVTHFEELDQFAGRDEIRNILQSTMRGGAVFWNFETYNPPVMRDSWVNRDALEERSVRLRHHSTYLEAPPEWLGPQFIAEAEHVRDTDERAYRHDYLGEATGSGGEVFDNLEIRGITDEEVAGFDRILMGIDWGWYPDPFHWQKVHWDPARRVLYLIDEYRANKQSNARTWAALKALKGVRDFDLITADSAE
ncbi:MAG: phage terminase large subunit, partial [Clostridia bacterium]|nr:phage terminase large subunit [Clostridia bacterium]